MHHLNSLFTKFLVAGLLLFLTTNADGADWLFKGGKSRYRIVVSAEASTSEQTAACELQQYIEEMSGVRLPITSNLKASKHSIIVGYNERVAALTAAPQPLNTPL